MHLLPRKRDALLTQSVGDETIVYDETIHKAFCLSAAAAAIWEQCDGASTLVDAAHAASHAVGMPVTAETALLTLTALDREGLLERTATLPSAERSSRPANLSRRRMMAAAGSAAVLMPTIFALMTPRAAEAYCHLDVNGHCILAQHGPAGDASGAQEMSYARHSRSDD